MNTQQWKNVLDHLDEDIVDSAAEHLSSDADGDSSEYHPDSKPREYRNIGRKRRHGGLFLGIGAAAAAAVAGVVVISNRAQQPVPVSAGAALRSASVEASDSLVIEDPAELVSAFKVSGNTVTVPSEFSAAELPLFQQYFYGTWSGQETMINLCYSANSAFGEDYVCTGIEQSADGCYMGALNSVSEYDLWFVPAESTDTMYIYRNVSLNDGAVIYDENGAVSCEETEKFEKYSASPNEYNVLGYFGRVKLADTVGMTPNALYNNVELDTFDGSDAGEAHWIREAGGYSSPWDKVVLKDQTDSSFVMSMAFTQSDDIARTMYFDLYWSLDDNGTWSMHNVRKSRDVFAMTADDLRVTLTLSDFDIFEMYFAGTWTSDTEEFLLNYTQDIFGCTGTCGGFYADVDGWYMYRLLPSTALESTVDGLWQHTQVYFVPYDDPNKMYVYEPDIFGYAGQENYLAVYTHTDSSLEELDASHMSWLGLQRWILDTRSTYDENSLSNAVYSAFKDIGNDSVSILNYNGSGDPFEGFVIEELSVGKYRLSFQLFDHNNKSEWVSVVLKFTDNIWEMLPVDGITADTAG